MGCCLKAAHVTKLSNRTAEKPVVVRRKSLRPICNDIKGDYEFQRVLGGGQFGTVRLATHKTRKRQQFAVKTIVKAELKKDSTQLGREIEILSALDHPNIIKLYAVYEDSKYLHLVTEYCSGGELFDRIVEKGHYSESEAARLMGKIFLAVNNLHANNICHRDLKPENFLFESSESSAELKLIDFGLSNKFFDKFAGVEMHSFVGTPHYVAPEVPKGEYGPKCDIWSAGVIMYVLLSGGLPFTGDSISEVLASVATGAVQFSEEIWTNVSNEAKDLLSHLLVLDPALRFSAEEALAHPWISSHSPQLPQIDPAIITSLGNCKSKSKFQSEACAIIVKNLPSKRIQALKDTFLALDTAKQGFLSFEKMESALLQAGFHPILPITPAFPHSTHINYSDFILAAIDLPSIMDDDALWDAFSFFDTDNSGQITENNLKEALARAGRDRDDEEISGIFREAARGQLGISFEEFKMNVGQAGH